MSNERQKLGNISFLLACWIADIRLNNAIDFQDINKSAEGVCMQLLNLVYNYELEDLNYTKRNFPGLDLADHKAKVAFQITSRTDAAKVIETLQKVKDDFPSAVKFFILNQQTKISFGKKNDPANIHPSFHAEKDILYPEDLLREIKNIYHTDPARFRKIQHLLERELIRFVPSDKVQSVMSGNTIDNLLKHLPHKTRAFFAVLILMLIITGGALYIYKDYDSVKAATDKEPCIAYSITGIILENRDGTETKMRSVTIVLPEISPYTKEEMITNGEFLIRDVKLSRNNPAIQLRIEREGKILYKKRIELNASKWDSSQCSVNIGEVHLTQEDRVNPIPVTAAQPVTFNINYEHKGLIAAISKAKNLVYRRSSPRLVEITYSGEILPAVTRSLYYYPGGHLLVRVKEHHCEKELPFRIGETFRIGNRMEGVKADIQRDIDSIIDNNTSSIAKTIASCFD
ncbi:SMEK domain-containing protein [Chitinophaga niabensis]|uniref:SMEK domain-containing protein n=1 Tax=Chitinophaga niabensis TaxID=536979 RepID=UPI0031BB22BF